MTMQAHGNKRSSACESLVKMIENNLAVLALVRTDIRETDPVRQRPATVKEQEQEQEQSGVPSQS